VRITLITELRLYSPVSFNLRNVVADSVSDTREKLSACRINNRLRGRQTYEKSGCALRDGRGISFMKFRRGGMKEEEE
jgi:hypothetical protein